MPGRGAGVIRVNLNFCRLADGRGSNRCLLGHVSVVMPLARRISCEQPRSRTNQMEQWYWWSFLRPEVPAWILLGGTYAVIRSSRRVTGFSIEASPEGSPAALRLSDRQAGIAGQTRRVIAQAWPAP